MADKNALNHDARVELNTMLDAVKRDADQFFQIGEMRAAKKLANGAVVKLSITMPSNQKKKRSAFDPEGI